MIVFIFGTTGELIKIYPVLHSLDRQGVAYELWCTGQQTEEIPDALVSLEIKTSVRWLTHGFRRKSLHSMFGVVCWLGKLSVRLTLELPALWRRRSRNFIVVHGDTMTTSIGAFFARLGLAQLAHIEAGMRSGNWRNPFPEELSRRFVAKLSHVNYAPGDIAYQNLKDSKGFTINTRFNTVVDALEIARAKSSNNKSGNFGLVSLHRSELYESEFNLTEIISALSEHSVSHPLIFIDHPVTAQKLTEYGLDQIMAKGNIKRIPKLNYWSFISLLGEASYVVTDSGGLQQECSITGQPCLVHRLVTESFEGVGENIILSELDINVVKSFLASTEIFAGEGLKPSISPTSIILEDFASRGLITQPGK